MLWLDSTFPNDADPLAAGKGRGTYSTDSGAPKEVASTQASAKSYTVSWVAWL